MFVTGANRGLGLCLCERFLEKGCRVYALLRKQSNEITELKNKHQENLFIYTADVTDEKQLRETSEKIKAQTAGIDILINNAGIHLEHAQPDFSEIDFSVYIPTFTVNALAPLMVVKYLLTLVKNGQKKLIVNISSEAGSIGNAWREREYAYCMSKAALNMASRILDNRLKKEGIKVLAVHPGWFSSDMGGAEAPITPEQAAAKVAGTLLKDWHNKKSIYIDVEGKEMPW
ncbi:MAG: SDR family oxidoreductase [Spirochaetales bacterium]|nr:SDR family oxidoreductase [Spirochaetales bacterium]